MGVSSWFLAASARSLASAWSSGSGSGSISDLAIARPAGSAAEVSSSSEAYPSAASICCWLASSGPMCRCAKFTAGSWSRVATAAVARRLPLCRLVAPDSRVACPVRSLCLRGSGDVAPSAPGAGCARTLPDGVLSGIRAYSRPPAAEPVITSARDRLDHASGNGQAVAGLDLPRRRRQSRVQGAVAKQSFDRRAEFFARAAVGIEPGTQAELGDALRVVVLIPEQWQ